MTTQQAVQIDCRPFKARDDSGNRYTIIAERIALPAFGGFPRYGPWEKLYLDDERNVRWDRASGYFFIEPDEIRLTPDDPAEPID